MSSIASTADRMSTADQISSADRISTADRISIDGIRMRIGVAIIAVDITAGNVDAGTGIVTATGCGVITTASESVDRN